MISERLVAWPPRLRRLQRCRCPAQLLWRRRVLHCQEREDHDSGPVLLGTVFGYDSVHVRVIVRMRVLMSSPTFDIIIVFRIRLLRVRRRLSIRMLNMSIMIHLVVELVEPLNASLLHLSLFFVFVSLSLLFQLILSLFVLVFVFLLLFVFTLIPVLPLPLSLF